VALRGSHPSRIRRGAFRDPPRQGSTGPITEGPYIRLVPFQELSPSRGWSSSMPGSHVLSDSPGRNAKSQSCEFGLDSSLTPEPVLSSHLPDERLKFLGNRPSSAPLVLPIGAPGPISTPAVNRRRTLAQRIAASGNVTESPSLLTLRVELIRVVSSLSRSESARVDGSGPWQPEPSTDPGEMVAVVVALGGVKA
jgi:hypothetical protein